MRRSIEYVIFAGCGIGMALPYIFPSLWFLAWVAFVPVMFCELSRSKDTLHPVKDAYFRGVFFFYPYGILTFYWFVELYPLDFTGMSKSSAMCVVLLGCLGLSLLQSLVWSLMFVLSELIKRKIGCFSRGVSNIILFPSLWVIFEWLQTQTWAGVPWGKLAMGQTNALPLIQSLSLFGPYFISFILILFSSLIAFFAYETFSKRKLTAASAVSILIAFLIFSSNLLFGVVRIHISDFESKGTGITVSAIQGNVSSVDKWSYDSLNKTYDAYERLTRDAARSGADLVVWPETALPYTLENSSTLCTYVSELASETDVSILCGAFSMNDDMETENSVYYISSNGIIGDSVYSKRRLVPFGEFVPMRKVVMTLIPPLNEIGMLDDDLIPGEHSAIHLTEQGAVGSLICFDSIYETLAYESVRDGAQLLSVSTNDSWFNDSSAVFQHNRHSVLRAVENGRYVVRSANTGVSSVISPVGEILNSIPPLVDGQITCEVRMLEDTTMYTHIGNVIVPVCVILAASLVIFDYFAGRKKYGTYNR